MGTRGVNGIPAQVGHRSCLGPGVRPAGEAQEVQTHPDGPSPTPSPTAVAWGPARPCSRPVRSLPDKVPSAVFSPQSGDDAQPHTAAARTTRPGPHLLPALSADHWAARPEKMGAGHRAAPHAPGPALGPGLGLPLTGRWACTGSPTPSLPPTVFPTTLWVSSTQKLPPQNTHAIVLSLKEKRSPSPCRQPSVPAPGPRGVTLGGLCAPGGPSSSGGPSRCPVSTPSRSLSNQALAPTGQH